MNALPHGQFERLFASHADPLPEPVRCSVRSAQCFMAIAKNTALSNTQHAALLPRDWTVLSGLAKLPSEKLEEAFAEGWISPETQRGDVKEIRERLAWRCELRTSKILVRAGATSGVALPVGGRHLGRTP